MIWFVPDDASLSPERRKKVWATVLAVKLFETHRLGNLGFLFGWKPVLPLGPRHTICIVVMNIIKLMVDSVKRKYYRE